MNSFPHPTLSPYFQQRFPSTQWENLPLSWFPGGYLWVWFKPAQAPSDLIVKVPDELLPVLANHLTMRHLLASLGLMPTDVQFWSIHGMAHEPQGGHNPLLDQFLPPPVPWGDNAITIRCFIGDVMPPASMPMPAQAMPQTSSAPLTAAAEQSLAAMDTDWNAIIQLESQLSQLRKQLNAVQGKLQAMNRDLSPDERAAADSNDVKNWQDARRFLRDAAGHTSRYIREHDVGITSSAGLRNRYEEIYKTYVLPRQNFEGISSAQHDFETYRKSVQSLLAKMQTALSNAGSNGEQRAQQVLSRISAKMRKSRNRE